MHRQRVAGGHGRRERAQDRVGPEAPQARARQQADAREDREAHEGRAHADIARHPEGLEEEARQMRCRHRRAIDALGDVVTQELRPVDPRGAEVNRRHREAEHDRSAERRGPSDGGRIQTPLREHERGEHREQEDRRDEIARVAADGEQADDEGRGENPPREPLLARRRRNGRPQEPRQHGERPDDVDVFRVRVEPAEELVREGREQRLAARAEERANEDVHSERARQDVEALQDDGRRQRVGDAKDRKDHIGG